MIVNPEGPQTDVSGDNQQANTQEPQAPEQQAPEQTQGAQQQPEAPEAPDRPRWIYQLPGDLQNDERLSSFDKPGDLAKAYLDYAGKAERLIEVPGDDATPEQRAAFLQKLGRPESPDGYTLAKPDNLPEGAPWDEERGKQFASTAHELGLTKGQAEKMFSWLNQQGIERYSQAMQARQQQRDQHIQQLREEWGDSFDENVAKVQRVFKALGNDELAQWADKTGAGNNPVVLKAFLNIWERVGDDQLFEGDQDREAPADDWYPNTNFDT